MSGIKHTPGPWLLRTFKHGKAELWVVDSTPDKDGRFVGSVIHQPLSNPDDEANARLITTAPDGLALAKRVLQYFPTGLIDPKFDCDIEVRQMARDLIAKAGVQ